MKRVLECLRNQKEYQIFSESGWVIQLEDEKGAKSEMNFFFNDCLKLVNSRYFLKNEYGQQRNKFGG